MKIACGLGLAALVAVAPSVSVRADETMATGDVTAVELPMASASADVLGGSLAYPAGTPEVRAYRITLPPKSATILHKHPVPLYAYILSGTLEVDYGVRGRKTYTAGQNFLEAVDWCHAGRAVGDVPVVLISVYIGADKIKNTVACPN
ncbi:MAG: cupin domain-containing protein [Alphaproteobacteria bacterium]|nr:cupin domain-containing protein [Alphaproteobacteria bacterium]